MNRKDVHTQFSLEFKETISEIKKLLNVSSIGSSNQLPILGICLGNQILALSAGAKTYKLSFGHRSQNQPVIDVLTKKAYITTQNHILGIGTIQQ